MRALLTVVVSPLLLVAACAPGPTDDGPLVPVDYLGAGGEWCLADFRPGGEVTLGGDVVTNEAEDPAEVTEARLVGSEGFELVDSYQRPSGRPNVAGFGSQWPPRRQVAAQLEPLSRIEPGERANIVLRLRSTPDATLARVDGVELVYRVGGDDHVTRTTFSLRWADSCASGAR